MLIFAQHARAYEEGRVPEPTPTFIAGFETWRALGRSVERGQHGYAILAPMRGMRRQARDAEGNVRALPEGTGPQGETETKNRCCEASLLPPSSMPARRRARLCRSAPRPHLLEGEAPRGLGAAVKELIESNGFAVDTVADASTSKGPTVSTDLAAMTVLVRADMDDAAMVKTLIHEAAHVLLHQSSAGRDLPRPLKEVEAEIVAYVVASVHGMPTDDYSFPYVAGWAGEDPDKAIRETQARVNVAARAIIAESPAEHTVGSKPPGTDLAVAAVLAKLEGEAATRKAELAAQAADNGAGATSTSYGGPEVA